MARKDSVFGDTLCAPQRHMQSMLTRGKYAMKVHAEGDDLDGVDVNQLFIKCIQHTKVRVLNRRSECALYVVSLLKVFE